MKIGNFDHLPLRDQLAMLRLLCHIDGLNFLRSFDAAVRAILAGAKYD